MAVITVRRHEKNMMTTERLPNWQTAVTWWGYAAGYTDAEILEAAMRRFDVSAEQLELRRNDGCVLVRIREENDDTNEG